MNNFFNYLQDLSLDNKLLIRSCIARLEREIPENLQGLNEEIESKGVANVYVPTFLVRDRFYRLLL